MSARLCVVLKQGVMHLKIDHRHPYTKKARGPTQHMSCLTGQVLHLWGAHSPQTLSDAQLVHYWMWVYVCE